MVDEKAEGYTDDEMAGYLNSPKRPRLGPKTFSKAQWAVIEELRKKAKPYRRRAEAPRL